MMDKKDKANLKDDDKDDDIMSDVLFTNRKGGNSRARSELLEGSILAGDNEGVRVGRDENGNLVLGGGREEEFGGRNISFRGLVNELGGSNGAANSANGVRDVHKGGGESAFSRDVSTLYEDLDIDQTEEFDNDDVGQGDEEIEMGGEEFEEGARTVLEATDAQAGGEGDGSDLSEDDDDDNATGGISGFGSRKGLDGMMMKARGEGPKVDENGMDEEDELGNKKGKSTAYKKEIGKKEEESEESEEEAEKEAESKKRSRDEDDEETNNGVVFKKANLQPLVDEVSGLRIMTQQTVHREIWLSGGKITMKKLSKVFAINKASEKSRTIGFMGFLKELCTMEGDKREGGKVLVLKQHYKTQNI